MWPRGHVACGHVACGHLACGHVACGATGMHVLPSAVWAAACMLQCGAATAAGLQMGRGSALKQARSQPSSAGAEWECGYPLASHPTLLRARLDLTCRAPDSLMHASCQPLLPLGPFCCGCRSQGTGWTMCNFVLGQQAD